MDNSFATGEPHPLSDVALAWKSLQKAKAVLQRIENKFCHQTGSRAKSQAARRKLWHEASFGGKRNRDDMPLNEKKSNELPPAHRKGSGAALSHFLASSGPSGISCGEYSRSAPCSAASGEAEDGEGTAWTWCPAKSPHRVRRDDFREQADSRDRTGQKGKSPCSLHHLPRSSEWSRPFSAVPRESHESNYLLPTHHLSPVSKLEELRKKSPGNKLEQVKKRIQEQKQKQKAASREQKCPNSAYAREALPEQCQKCKVASAPPAPVYRGFSDVDLRSSLSSSDEGYRILGRGKFTIPGQRRIYERASNTPGKRERNSAQRIQMQSQRQPSPMSSVLGKAVTGKDAKLLGASAWREGQKLARKLLGPRPAFPNTRSTAEEQTTADTFEPSRGFLAVPVMESSSRGKENEPACKNSEFQSCVIPPSNTIGWGSNVPTEYTKQILRDLHLQSHYHDEHRHIPKYTTKGKAEVLQRYVGTRSLSPGPWGISPFAFSEKEIKPSLMKDGAKPSTSGNCMRKSTSQREKGSAGLAQEGSEKENLKYPSGRRVNIKRPHPYSPEIVREFMYRKNEERRKKILEEKRALVQAREMRNKRLQEVYRKQREAVGKKTCSGQMHKLIMETAAGKESPRGELKQEEICGGILEKNSVPWMDKTSSSLSSKDHRDSNQLETVRSPKKREALPSPAPLEPECWCLRPLKCEDLKDCTHPALPTPPLSFSVPQEDAEPYSKGSTSGLSPTRNSQDRVKAIHNLCKELAEKMEMATKRLNSASWIKNSCDKTSSETTWGIYNTSSSVPEPETSKEEQDRTMTLQMLLDTDPAVLCVSSDGEFQVLGRISLVGGTEGATALEKMKEILTPSPGGSAAAEELPWVPHDTGQRHGNTRGEPSDPLQGFPVNKGSGVDISLLHEKPITSPASPSHRSLTRSRQGELAAQRNHWPSETNLKVQNEEEIAAQSYGESLRTPDSLQLQPSAALSPGAETQDSTEQDFASAGEGDPGYTAPQEKHRSCLDDLREVSLPVACEQKVHQLQQKQQLATLREKTELEVQESQSFFSNLLQNNSGECSSSKGSYPVPKLDHAEQTWRGHQVEDDNAAGSNLQMKQSSLKIEGDHSPVDPKIEGERKPLGGSGSYHSVLQEESLAAEHRELLHGHQTLNLLSPPTNLPHGETSAGESSLSGQSSPRSTSDSQWSEVSQCDGDSGSFCQFSLAMMEQYLRGEELRAQYQAALLELRKKALQEKARAELAWLDHEKRCLEKLQDSKGASAIAAKQHKILTELQEEQAEIQHLQNIHRAAHQGRKFLLKQQEEILMMQDSTAKLQEKLRILAGKQEPTRSPATEAAMKLRTERLISSPTFSFSSAEPAAHPEKPELSENRESCVQLKNKQNKQHEGFSTESKKTPVQHEKQAEESPGSEQSRGAQGPDAFEMATEKLCGAASQTAGSVFMIKDCKNTEHNVQDHVLLPLEHATSTRMDESIPTPITKEGKKRAFLESALEKKALISNPKIDPKDNEDIKPRDSKFPAKGLEMLSALCNLCLVQAENSLQGTVEEVEVPVPYEIHQVDGSQRLKHLDHIFHKASDEELNLKAFSEGLASTESSSKSNNFSLRCQSARSDSSLPEFQKVSAVWIDISESSISDSELELKNGKDTDVSIPEEFVCDDGDVFPTVSEGTLTAVSTRKEMLPSDKHNEREVTKDDSVETSSHSQKHPGDVSDHGCTDGLLSFIPSDKANAFETMSADSTQPDNPAKGMDEPHLDTFESNSRNKTSSQEMTKQGKDAVASSSCSDDICSSGTYEKQKASCTTSGVKKNGGMNSLFVDQNRELIGFSLTGSLEHVDVVTDQGRNTVSFPPDKDITNNRLLARLSSRNLLVSGGKNNHAQLLNEVFESSKLNEVVCLSMSVPGIPEEDHTETNSCESLQRVVTGNPNNATAERQALKEARRGLLSSVSSEKRLFQAENCSSKGEDDTIFISDEGLPPTDEDTLSEILSPVDEVLSYGSADLPSSNKKDLSFPSEDLPPPPLSADAMKNDDSTFTTDDFPSPPEQMTVSETRQCTDEDISLKMDALPPSPENTVPEEFPLLNPETTDAFSTRDGIPSEQSLVKYSSAKEGLLEYQQGEHETSLQHLGCLPVASSVFSDQASKSPDFTMQRCKTYSTLHKGEEDGDDPLLPFAIGDRVLVKQTQPGTLMFKGQTCFDSGHWAGVALDKAEGDNAGTYKGVKYFECAQHCGIFVRPDEISHLLEANKTGSNHTEDEDSDSSCDDESFKRDSKYSEDDEQRAGFTEQKGEDTKSEGGSEVKENQSRLHSALLSGKGQKLPHSHQSKCNEFLCQNNLTCLGSDKEKTEPTQIKQRILADVLPVTSKTGNIDEVNTSKNICCSVEDQKRNKFPDDIAGELSKKLLLDTLIAFSERAQHKYINAFEKDMLNYVKSLREEDSQKLFLLKENSVAILPEQSAKVSGDLLCDFNMVSVHGCHTVAERIVTKFVHDAVKEYKKIKRKHPSKPDKTFHSSSETSPSTLPFLRKILDAGVFGSSEDFDQPNSDQHMLVHQTQKQYMYKLDQWHSAPWKKTVEIPLVIPHHSSYVKELSAYAVEELWTPENINSNFRGISLPKYVECNDLPGNDLEAESKRMYNQVIFDLTRELLCAEYQVTANPNTFPWMKENLGSHCSRHLCRRDVSEVKMFVQGEIIKIMNLEKNDLEMKRNFLNMTKYGNCKRDRVDLILIQELHKEESQWTNYDDDELTVKMRMTEDIFDSLILDTIGVLNEIHLRKACE